MERSKRYEYLLWDVDGTLLDFAYSERVSLCRCLEKIGAEPTEEMIACYSRINDGYWKRLEKGEVTKDQLQTGRFVDFFAQYGILCEDVEGFKRAFQQSLGNVYRYMEDSLEICRRLKEMGYHQYTVTNGVTATQENKLKLSGFAQILDGVFISEQVGAPKPRKEFFEACFARISEEHEDFDKAKVLIIGDSLSSDIKGGVNAGIDTCWYRSAAEGFSGTAEGFSGAAEGFSGTAKGLSGTAAKEMEESSRQSAGDPGQTGLPVPTYEIRSLQEIFEIV